MMILKKVLVIVMLLAGIATIATANQTIFIDPIGSHKAGEPFNITGSTTIEKCKKIGVEIFPKEYWKEIEDYARVDDAGRVKFREISAPGDANASGSVNLLRFNPDGTQSYEPFMLPEDHLITIVPVEADDSGKMTWNAEISQKVKDVPFYPGRYQAIVYDASMVVDRPGVLLPNGWDIIKKKTYPSTAMANIWNEKNEKDMEIAEFTIR